MANDDPLRLLIKNLTLIAALLGYSVLTLVIVWQTWEAKPKAPPTIPDVQSAALAGLALVLGAGYAAVLGIPVTTTVQEQLATQKAWDRIKAWLTSALAEHALLGAGVVLYLAASIAICVTYAANEAETPTVLRTIAVGFAGYVVAYLGAAYQRFSAP